MAPPTGRSHSIVPAWPAFHGSAGTGAWLATFVETRKAWRDETGSTPRIDRVETLWPWPRWLRCPRLSTRAEPAPVAQSTNRRMPLPRSSLSCGPIRGQRRRTACVQNLGDFRLIVDDQILRHPSHDPGDAFLPIFVPVGHFDLTPRQADYGIPRRIGLPPKIRGSTVIRCSSSSSVIENLPQEPLLSWHRQKHRVQQPILLAVSRVQGRQRVSQSQEVRAAGDFVLDQSAECIRSPAGLEKHRGV